MPVEDKYLENARREVTEWETQEPGFLAQVGDFVLWPIQKSVEILTPEGVQEAVAKAIEAFLGGLSLTSQSFLIDAEEVQGRVATLRQSEGHILRSSDLAAKHYWNRREKGRN